MPFIEQLEGRTLLAADADDQIREAVALAIGGSRAGAIAPATDVDLYKFTVTAGRRVGFDVDRTPGSALDSYLRVFDAAGRPLAANDNANAPSETAVGPKASYLAYTFAAAGTYYVGVSGRGNAAYNPTTGAGDAAGSAGGFTLTLTALAPPAPADGNDQIAEAAAVAIGGSVAGTITLGTTPTTILPDVDLFKVDVAAGQTIGFDVDPGTPGTLDSYLRLFDAAGAELAANDNAAAPGEDGSTPTTSYLEHTFAEAGTFYIGVSGSLNRTYDAVTGLGDALGSTGGYTLAALQR